MDGTAAGSLNLSDECECLEHEQRNLSRKQHGSNNYKTQRRWATEYHADIRRKRRDFLHKLSNYYAREYDLVAVEDPNVKRIIESPSNSWNITSSAWRTFPSLLEYKYEREGAHFVAVCEDCAPYGNPVVPAQRVVEAGSLTLDERAASVVSE